VLGGGNFKVRRDRNWWLKKAWSKLEAGRTSEGNGKPRKADPRDRCPAATGENRLGALVPEDTTATIGRGEACETRG